VGDIFELGKRMKSCVGSRAEAALQGRCSIFAATVDRRALAVELTHLPNGRVYCSEVAGTANRAVTRDEMDAMRPWLTAIGALG